MFIANNLRAIFRLSPGNQIGWDKKVVSSCQLVLRGWLLLFWRYSVAIGSRENIDVVSVICIRNEIPELDPTAWQLTDCTHLLTSLLVHNWANPANPPKKIQFGFGYENLQKLKKLKKFSSSREVLQLHHLWLLTLSRSVCFGLVWVGNSGKRWYYIDSTWRWRSSYPIGISNIPILFLGPIHRRKHFFSHLHHRFLSSRWINKLAAHFELPIRWL